MNSRLPDFLIVGAMKGGTTTLYYDLGDHPDLHLPDFKEPEILLRHDDPSEIRRDYSHHFKRARPGQLCGEASTGYTKRPEHEGVAEKAREALGDELRIVYITREPVARALSHYRHDRQHGTVGGDFDEAVRKHRRYVDYSRYEWQIAPWKAAFGEDRVFEIRLEDYSRDKQELLTRLLRFLGADPARLGTVDSARKANSASEAKAIGNPLLRALIESDFYQYRVKPLVPRSLREMARRRILPEPEAENFEVSPETRQFILAQLRDNEPLGTASGRFQDHRGTS